MNGRPFSFADAEATFPDCAEIVERSVKEAPRFTPEQIACGQRLFASFGTAPIEDAPADAA